MRIGIISDIHSNYEALVTVLDWLDEEKVDEIICLGDVVGYGPDPNLCCDLVRRRCTVTLMGNHDAAVIGAMTTDFYYAEAREAIYWTRRQLSDENFQWLYSLPYTHVRDDAAYFHAAPVKPSDWLYVTRTQDAMRHNGPLYDRLRGWNFVGHSHLTKTFAVNGSRAKDVSGLPLTLKSDRKFLVNVGSVGQPRDRDSRLCFGLYDNEAGTFEHIRLPYDIDAVARKIVGAGLYKKFAERLFVGQ